MELARVVAPLLLASKKGSNGTSVESRELAEGLTSYEARRRPRVAACRTVTAFTHYLCARPQLARLMRFVPPQLNGSIFDAFLSYSLYAAGQYAPPNALS